MSAYNFIHSKPNFTRFPKDRSRQRRLDFVAMFIGSIDICAQTRKLS